ncbi:TLC domain-containing protein [Endogone sp. FLAS-F59071]|nr:TLC domain-containing protein [Endogone sp. FLAS-F59071]|eukprot:RUS19719.1 TLC domain-containing protein [Endogone sp. FLAS-F59071]
MSKPASKPKSALQTMPSVIARSPAKRLSAKRGTKLRQAMIYLAEHQIDLPFKVVAVIVAGAVLQVPFFWRFLFISYRQPATGLYGKGLADVMFLFFWINLFTMLRAAFMQYVLTPLGKWGQIKSQRKLTRFAEQTWTVIYYSLSWGVGMYLCYNSPYWYNSSEFWKGYPHIYLAPLFKYYYLIQFAYWLQQIFVLQIEEPRKDYRELVVHHINTLLLISASYICNYTRIGNAVFVCMDVADILLALAKSFNYLNYRTLCDALFILLIITWTYTRVFLYGCIIWSTWIEPDLYVDFGLDFMAGRYFPYFAKYIILALELCLFSLILFWTYFMYRVLARVLMGVNASDSRSDDEEELAEPVKQLNGNDKALPNGKLKKKST